MPFLSGASQPKRVRPTILTQGLVDVCEVRPEDPIDYLAEWLFRHNPQLEAEMN